MRVLHVLHTSLPYVCGYSLRSDQILSLQRGMNIEVAVVTSAQQPDSAADEVLNGVSYFRTLCELRARPPLREFNLMRSLESRISEVCGRFRPDIIHAHSPVLVGLPALRVAKRKGLPLVYEVRDLWENASVDRGKFGYRSVSYRVARMLETFVLRRASAVVTIGETLRQELENRVCREVAVTPNGVDTELFRPTEPSEEWERRWNPLGRQIIAYIGAFQPYEGLDVLIEAMPSILDRRGHGIQLLIVGDGPERSGLESLAARIGVGSHVTFAGRVPHGRVREIYSIADLMVYPRIATLTTQLTTPLKPLEALSMQKAVLASDLPAMKELISDQVTGLLFRPGDPADLANKAVRFLGDEALRAKLGAEGRVKAERERQWTASIERYLLIYEKLIVGGGASPGMW